MKSLSRLAFTILGLVAFTHVASAVYEPNLQRWINRDPVGDLAFHRLALGRSAGPPKNLGRPKALENIQGWVAQLRKAFSPPKDIYAAAQAFLGTDSRDANFYNFAANGPTSAVDPVGLTGWQFTDPFGKPLPMPQYHCTDGDLCRLGCFTFFALGTAWCGSLSWSPNAAAACITMFTEAARECLNKCPP